MALPPRLRLGVSNPSYDGRYYPRWPQGNRPEISQPMMGNALSIAGAQGGLVTAIRAVASAGVSATATADLSTSGGGGSSYSGAGSLVTDAFVKTRLPLQWGNPTASPGPNSFYSVQDNNFDYKAIFTPMFGSPPYRFMAVADDPDGFYLVAVAPESNPHCYLWCEIVILKAFFQSGSRTYTVYCQDQMGAIISRTITTTNDNSRTLAFETGVGGGGDGTVDNPFESVNQMYLSNAADATHAGKICRYLSGTFEIDNFDSSVDTMRLDSNKPRIHIAAPGVEWAFSANISTGTTGAADWHFEGMRCTGGASPTGIVRIFSMLGTTSRAVWKDVSWDTPTWGSNTGDNTSCIYSSGAGFKSKTNISIVNCRWEGLTDGDNGFSMFDLYGADDVAVLGGTGRNLSCRYGAWPKNRCNKVFIAGLDLYDTTNTGLKMLFTANGDADTGAVVQLFYSRVARSSDGSLIAWPALCYGDNNAWGSIYWDRNTVLGRAGIGGSFETGGTIVIERNMVFNDVTPKINSAQTLIDNVTGTRSQAATHLDANGNTLLSSPHHGFFGSTVMEAA